MLLSPGARAGQGWVAEVRRGRRVWRFTRRVRRRRGCDELERYVTGERGWMLGERGWMLGEWGEAGGRARAPAVGWRWLGSSRTARVVCFPTFQLSNFPACRKVGRTDRRGGMNWNDTSPASADSTKRCVATGERAGAGGDGKGRWPLASRCRWGGGAAGAVAEVRRWWRAWRFTPG